MKREQKIVKISLQGIGMNISLVLLKAVVGFLSNSIAIILDAINNLSDAVSAVITIVGAKLSSKAPDREHPFGHGRIEYFSAVIIAVLVLSAGIFSLRESIIKVVEPAEVHYTWLTLVAVIIAIFVKFIFGKYAEKNGKEIDSQSLIATGADAYMDAVLSFSTLVGAVINMIWGFKIEGYLGIVISILIIKAAVGILRETIDSMIGQRADSELTKKIKERINNFDGVLGTYDLMLHNYGPSMLVGSAHIEVSDSLTAREIHILTRKISKVLYEEFEVFLTLGIYASNNSGIAKEIKSKLENIIHEEKDVIQSHGLYVDDEKKEVSFDLILDFNCKDREGTKEKVIGRIKEAFPDYNYNVVLDSDISD